MSLIKTTELIAELCEAILQDIPKVNKGNKTAAQRVRTNSIKFTKIAKEWRKLSLESEKKDLKKKRARAVKKIESRRKKS